MKFVQAELGGAQKIYNVKPDISQQGMANGYPLSIIAIKRKL